MMIGSESIFLHQNKLAKPYLKRQLARFNDHNEIRRTHARGNREIEVGKQKNLKVDCNSFIYHRKAPHARKKCSEVGMVEKDGCFS